MITSEVINALNVRIHELIILQKDLRFWEYSPELHSLLARRKNFVNELINKKVVVSIPKTLADFDKVLEVDM